MSRHSAPCRTWRAGGSRVPDPPCGRAAGVAIDADAGIERVDVVVSRGPGDSDGRPASRVVLECPVATPGRVESEESADAARPPLWHDGPEMLPESARAAMEAQLAWVRTLHERDCARGRGCVALPTSLDRKAPSRATDLACSWVFPASRECRDAATDESCGITCTRPRCSLRFSVPCGRRGSRSGRPVTRSVTRSRPTCSKTGTTSGRCRALGALGREHDDDIQARAARGRPGVRSPADRLGAG